MEHQIKEIVQEFIDIIDYAVTVDVRCEDEMYYVDINGENLGLLIGFHGKNIESIENIVNLMILNKLNTFIRISLDINDYKKNHLETISKYIDSTIKQMSENDSIRRLSPMSSYERLFVHNYVKKYGQISTVSEGEEPNRFIILEYKKED